MSTAQESMQAIVQDVFGGPEVLHFATVPRPVPGPRDLLVQVKAVSVNPVDTKVRAGGPANEPVPEAPRILGWDAAGVVAAVGPKARLFSAGDAVFCAGDITRAGSYAEYVAVDERIVGRKPTALSFDDAAAIPLTALTAWEGIIETMGAHSAHGEPAHTILIVGGAGGVGSIAIQIAKRVCNLHVVATASRPESAEHCRGMGADVVIDHRRELAPQLREHDLEGADYCFTTARLADFGGLVACLNPLGKICAILGGDEAKALDVSGLFQIRGSLSFEFMFTRPKYGAEPEKQGQILNRVSDLLDQGVLVTTRTEVHPWGEVQAAHRALASGHTLGKLVLRVD
jgi:NADPH2:quinone reductase